MTNCPVCRTQVVRPAAEGGVVLRNRYVRVTSEGEIVVGCPGCATELLAAPQTPSRRFRLQRRNCNTANEGT